MKAVVTYVQDTCPTCKRTHSPTPSICVYRTHNDGSPLYDMEGKPTGKHPQAT